MDNAPTAARSGIAEEYVEYNVIPAQFFHREVIGVKSPREMR